MSDYLTGFIAVLVIGIVVGVLATAAALLTAQMAVWGLAQFRVNSGLLGPWLLVMAAESVVSGGVFAASLNKN